MPSLLNWRPLALAGLFLLCLPGHAQSLNTPSAVFRNEQIQASLLVHAPQGVQAGQSFWLGLHLQHQKGWHSYWKNPGDSGLPTRLHWHLPTGLVAGDLRWPVPKAIPLGPLQNYGYEGEVLLPVSVQVAKSWPGTAHEVAIELKAEWLVCRSECIPQEASFALRLPTQSSSALHGALFDSTLQALPKAWPAARVQTRFGPSGSGKQLEVQTQHLPAHWSGQTVRVFPETAGVFWHAAAVSAHWQGHQLQWQWPLAPDRSASPQQLSWLLSGPGGESLQIRFSVQGPWPQPGLVPGLVSEGQASDPPQNSAIASGIAPAASGAARASIAATAPSAAPVQPGERRWTLLWAVGAAFLGGLLLNLMPCVFPVLAIKLLHLAEQARHARPQAARASAWAYGAGVIGSFVFLGAWVLGLRSAGEAIGWGFQLQSPAVLCALALLFTALALNLWDWLGWASLNGLLNGLLPARWTQKIGAWSARHPVLDAGLSGVLAVVVASPCTGPFMGATLGLALTLPAWQALPIFASMGLGLALPYVLGGFWPGVVRCLPRPGPWMQHLRHFMAWPLWLTVLWLLWVLGQVSGLDALVAAAVLLLLFCFALWVLRLGPALWLRALLILGLGAAAWGLAPQLTSDSSTPSTPNRAQEKSASKASGSSNPATTSTANSRTPDFAESGWTAWSAQAVEQARARGQTVFVDFTAAWCVTCQFNKKMVLDRPEVQQAFARHRVLALRADWTRRDSAIGQALTELGRSGVPVYAIYRAGQPPQLLSELPSVSEIEDALQAPSPSPRP